MVAESKSIRVSLETYETIRRHAKANGLTMQEVVRRAVDEESKKAAPQPEEDIRWVREEIGSLLQRLEATIEVARQC